MYIGAPIHHRPGENSSMTRVSQRLERRCGMDRDEIAGVTGEPGLRLQVRRSRRKGCGCTCAALMLLSRGRIVTLRLGWIW